MIGAVPAFLGGLMLATMPMFHGWARLARCDTLLALLVASFLFVYHLAAEPMARGSRLILWALLGLAVLDKGLAGAGLVATVIALDAFVGGRTARLRALVDPPTMRTKMPMASGSTSARSRPVRPPTNASEAMTVATNPAPASPLSSTARPSRAQRINRNPRAMGSAARW